MQISIKITLKSPALLTSNTGDPNMVETYPYIPARAIRGLFAGQYIKKLNLKDAHRDERFHKWFLRGDMKFTDAFILSDNKLHIPVPFSVQEEKRGKDIYDLLSVEEDFDIQTKYLNGFGRIEDSTIYTASVRKSLNFHHARDREKGVSKEGLIFNYESLDPEQSFGGYIYGREEDLKEFLSLFSDGIYYLGRSKNNQYGKVFIELDSKFQDHPQPERLRPGELSLTFTSDTIIHNGHGFPVADVRGLEEITGCKIKKAFIKTSVIEGFISVWRLKTPSEVSFEAGSTFLIEVPDQKTLDKLLSLQKEGIGERREEGFGRFMIGALREEKLNSPTKEEKLSEPAIPSPPVLQEIISETLKKYTINTVRSEAIQKAIETDIAGLTPSLAGRLLLMLRDSEGPADFKEKLNKLRKIAKDKLEDCRVKDRSLYEFLTGFNHLELLISNLRKRNSFTALMNLSRDIFEDEGFKESLTREYLQSFLSILLKEAKKK